MRTSGIFPAGRWANPPPAWPAAIRDPCLPVLFGRRIRENAAPVLGRGPLP